MDHDDLVAAIRSAFSDVGEDGLPRDEAIKRVARELGFDRAGKRIRQSIEGGLRAASRRGVVYSKRGHVYPHCKRFRDYSREELKEALLAVMGRTW